MSKFRIAPSRLRIVPGLTEVQPMRVAEAAAAMMGSVTEFHLKPGALAVAKASFQVRRIHFLGTQESQRAEARSRMGAAERK